MSCSHTELYRAALLCLKNVVTIMLGSLGNPISNNISIYSEKHWGRSWSIQNWRDVTVIMLCRQLSIRNLPWSQGKFVNTCYPVMARQFCSATPYLCKARVVLAKLVGFAMPVPGNCMTCYGPAQWGMWPGSTCHDSRLVPVRSTWH